MLFIVLESLAVRYYSRSTSYTEATILSASNSVVGRIHGWAAAAGDYFYLARTNRLLLDRIAELENAAASPAADTVSPAGAAVAGKYSYMPARVTYNSVGRRENYFVLDRGADDGVEPDMAVLGADGSVAGYVLKASDRFSVCMSVLSRDFRAGGRIKGKEYFGSVGWDGRDPRRVVLSEVPTYAPVEAGDTVVSAFSARFPPDMPIGVVERFEVGENNTAYDITVRLFADMGRLRDVLLVKYADRCELLELAEPFTELD